MRNRAIELLSFEPVAGQELLLDANVWLLVLGLPSGLRARGDQSGREYSAALKRFRMAKALLLIDAIVMSEVVNRTLRERYRSKFHRAYADYKQFRQSKDFEAVGREVAGLVRDILRVAQPADTSLQRVDMTWITQRLELGGMDFNDAVLVQSCLLKGWTLVTHDGDLTEGGIEVVTANQKLLTACPIVP